MPTVRVKLDLEKPLELSEEAKARYDAMRDEDIDFSDIPELDERFTTEIDPDTLEPKPVVTIQVDEDVIAWFKREDPKGYALRMAEVLHAYVRAKEKV